MTLHPTRFSIDFIGEDVVFDGFTSGETWNGWACPHFTFEQAQHLVRSHEAKGFKAWYDETLDAFSFEVGTGGDLREVDTFPAEVIDGKKFYPVGAYCWIWEETIDSPTYEKVSSLSSKAVMG